MTSQHFTTAADGWAEDWGDWGDSSNPSTNRNNNNIVSSSNNPNTLQPLNNPQVRKFISYSESWYIVYDRHVHAFCSFHFLVLHYSHSKSKSI